MFIFDPFRIAHFIFRGVIILTKQDPGTASCSSPVQLLINIVPAKHENTVLLVHNPYEDALTIDTPQVEVYIYSKTKYTIVEVYIYDYLCIQYIQSNFSSWHTCKHQLFIHEPGHQKNVAAPPWFTKGLLAESSRRSASREGSRDARPTESHWQGRPAVTEEKTMGYTRKKNNVPTGEYHHNSF